MLCPVDNHGPPNRIRALRDARSWSQQQLAEAVRPKTTQPTIDRLEKGKRKLTQEWMQKIGVALEVEPAGLLPQQGLNSSTKQQLKHPVAPPNQSGIVSRDGGRTTFAGPRDLPILGYVKAGGLGFFIGNGERQGVTVRPEALQDVSTAYAVRVHDESMQPVVRPGHLLYVDPTRPVKQGDLVVIQLDDGQAFIKHLMRRTEKALICMQYNPAGEIKYSPAKVAAVHLVIAISLIDL